MPVAHVLGWKAEAESGGEDDHGGDGGGKKGGGRVPLSND